MGVFYTEAAKRHETDAKLLDEAGRFANANHLLGFAAECALKAVLRALYPTLFEPDGDPVKHKIHINKLWPQIATIINGRDEEYLALPKTNAFDLWSVHARYAADADGPRAETHEEQKRGAEACLKLLVAARENGHKEETHE